MTFQLLHSEFPYIWGNFDFLFYQCAARLLIFYVGLMADCRTSLSLSDCQLPLFFFNMLCCPGCQLAYIYSPLPWLPVAKISTSSLVVCQLPTVLFLLAHSLYTYILPLLATGVQILCCPWVGDL
jgi:hypothetical protein